jgi:alkylated DNA repair dioxygenase AlkB
MEAPITYLPGFFKNPDDLFAALQKADWLRHEDSNRCEYYCNDFPLPYTYGRGRGVRTYQVQPYLPEILEIRAALEAEAKTVFEVCFLNRYLNQSDSLGWHADDSPEMDDARPIGIVSFGVEREIWFRPKPRTLEAMGDQDMWSALADVSQKPVPDIQKLKLGHGSLCLMGAGMQDLWEHRIPKASFQCGERISMTFRGYVKTGV